MRKLGIDYGEVRIGLAITDSLNITVQGLRTISYNGNDKIFLKELDNILLEYEIDTFVIGMPINMNGTEGPRVQKTTEFIHKLKCKYNNIKVEIIDERLTTVSAIKTMNFLDIDKNKKRKLVDTISAQYILEIYMKKLLQNNE